MTKAEQPTITQTEKDAAALKPCPWCGATCIVVTADNQDFAVTCGFCRCFGPRNVSRTEAMAAWNTRTTSLAAQDGLVEALEYARSQIIGLAVSGTDRIDELCKKLQKVDPSPIWPIPFPDPPERTWQPIVKRIDDAMSAIKGDK